MNFKKALCYILSLILILSIFTFSAITTTASTDEKISVSMGGRGIFYDADGYRIIPKGRKWTLGPVSGHYNDYVTNVSWTTTNKKVVALNNAWDRYCTVTAVGEGICSVNGVVESYYPLNADLKYMDNIHKFRVSRKATSISLKNMTINAGKTKMLKYSTTPSGDYCFYAAEPIFTSSNNKVATVDRLGNITALKKGTTTITVATSNGITEKCKITVKVPAVKKIKITKSQLILLKGKTKQLKAKLYPAKSSAKIKWSSSNKKVATVNSKGLINAKKAGKATIVAKVNSKIKSMCKVTVKNPPKSISFNKTAVTVRTGNTYKIKYTLKGKNSYGVVKWYSNNKNVATINSKGIVSAIAPGVAKITAKTVNGKKAICNVTVKYPLASQVTLNKPSLTLSVGEKEKLVANVTPYNYDGILTWSSSNTNVATVDHEGNITSISVGTAIITAKAGPKAVSKCTVEVNDLPLDPNKYLNFYIRNTLSWASANKTVYYTDTSGIGFDVCAESTILKDAENHYFVLEDISKNDASVYLTYNDKFKENNITHHSFYIVFDGVKYLVEGSYYSGFYCELADDNT